MDELINQLNAVVPQKYQAWLLLAYVLSTQAGRAMRALADGRGIKGTISAVWLGTNAPRDQVEIRIQQPTTTGNTVDQPTKIL